MRRAMAMMMVVAAALAGPLGMPLAKPVQADPTLAGTWQGTVTGTSTQMVAVYSPVTGVSLQPQVQVRVMPAPFGPLILTADGWYKVPLLGHSGRWWLDDAGALAFDGPLVGMAPATLRNGERLTLTLRIPGPDGTINTVDYSLSETLQKP